MIDACYLAAGKEQVHLRSRERSPAPCTGQLWVARGRWRGKARKLRGEESVERLNDGGKVENYCETDESERVKL